MLTILVHDFRNIAVVKLSTAAEWASNAAPRLRWCWCSRIFGGGELSCKQMFVFASFLLIVL